MVLSGLNSLLNDSFKCEYFPELVVTEKIKKECWVVNTMTTSSCPNHKLLEQVSSSLDRLEEAAWFIRLMEDNYHYADRFRWSLNSFLRVLKEVQQVLTMELQHHKEAAAWLKSHREELSSDGLLSFLYKQRDIVVHKRMLKPASSGIVGFTRGKGIKLGLGVPIDPLEDSEVAILKYIWYAVRDSDFMGILYTEEDGSGEYTCVERVWRIEAFPEKEITELATEAWGKVATLAAGAAEKLGASVSVPLFELRHANHVRIKIFPPEFVKENLISAKAAYRETEW